MNANQTSPPDLLPPPESPEAAGTRARRSLADRILAWSFLASVVVNIAWVALVSHSNLFGGGAVPALKEHPIKVFHPIPVKPKPKKKELPPPPPPKQRKITPPKPLKPIIHPPRPTPPRPAPPQPSHQVTVVRTNNKNAPPAPFIPDAPVTDNSKPFISSPGPPVVVPKPEPPVEQAPPIKYEPPVQQAPPVKYEPPVQKAPPVKYEPPKSAIPDRDEPEAPASIDTFSLPDGLDASTISNPNPTAEYDVDAQGHAHNIHISTGNPEVDRLLKEKIESTRFKPAVHNGVPEEMHATHAFSIG